MTDGITVRVDEIRHTVTVNEDSPHNVAVALVGLQGARGSIIHKGTGEPDPELGAVGDYWLDSSTTFLWGPKTQEGWGNEYVNLGGIDNVNQLPGFAIGENPVLGEVIQYDGTNWVNAAIRFTHIQTTPSAVWTITHNLGAKPGGVIVVDSSDVAFYGDLDHLDLNVFRVSFASPQVGKVYVS